MEPILKTMDGEPSIEKIFLGVDLLNEVLIETILLLRLPEGSERLKRIRESYEHKLHALPKDEQIFALRFIKIVGIYFMNSQRLLTNPYAREEDGA